MLPPVRGLRFLGQRTGTAVKGGCKGLPVGTASTGASAASEERSRLCILPAPCQPSAEEPSDSTDRGGKSPSPPRLMEARPREATECRWPPPPGWPPSGARRREPSGLSARRPLAGWQWSALLDRGASCRAEPGVRPGSQHHFREARRQAQASEPRRLRRLASSAAAAGERGSGARQGGSAGLVPSGRYNAVA